MAGTAGLVSIGAGIAAAGTEPPRVRIRDPDDGDTVSDVVEIEVRADERDEDLDRVELAINDEVATTETSDEFTFAWDTTGLSGSHTITATAHDVEGNTASASITVTVEADDAPDEDDADDADEEEDEDIPTLEALRLSHPTAVGGDSLTGFAEFDQMGTDGRRVFLESSHPDIVEVPDEAKHLWEDGPHRAFDIDTNPVEEDVEVTISAEACCVAQGEASVTLTVTPDGERIRDEVEIDRARCDTGRFRIRATSTSEQALLRVFSPPATTT